MVYRLIIKPRAENDLAEAITWYESRKSGLGKLFLDQVEKYLNYIRRNPFQYPSKRRPYREAFIKMFPYLIIYEVVENEVIVYSVFNTYRDPRDKL
ncbi:MAG: type II toxin-antitoxin system RelE/ParE family toxin [Bacteroidales bacterium]|nr:type II toxin-antitoxin system RelE/ParE family toxin [Bacteroidales bacterium]